jgi:hypothetical protein
MKQLILVTVVTALAVSAQAEVTDSAENGFTTVHEVVIGADRAATWAAAVGEVGRWWSDDHTITGSADNMSIRAQPQGCFCESLGNGGGVVHLTVTFVNPGTLLRLTGGLGPLGLMGVDGNMTWEFFDHEDGTRVRFAYAVGGYRPGGLGAIALPVDYVIGEALQRLKAHIETGDAEQASVE